MITSTKTALALTALALVGTAVAPRPAAAQTVYNFQIANPNLSGSQNFTVYAGAGALTSGEAPTVVGGYFWNQSDGAFGSTQTFTTGLASDGTPSNIGLTVTGGTGIYTYGTPATGPKTGSTDPAALFTTYAYNANAAPAVISLTGLGANLAYTLDLYGEVGDYNPAPGSRITAFTLGGNTQDTYATGNDEVFIQTSGGTQGNFVQFTGMTDATGDLTVDYTYAANSGDKEGDFNGLQISLSPTPEPSELAALGLGLLGLGGLALRVQKRGVSASA